MANEQMETIGKDIMIFFTGQPNASYEWIAECLGYNIEDVKEAASIYVPKLMDLPLTVRIANAFEMANISSFEQLIALRKKELLALPNLGKSSFDWIERFLKELYSIELRV